MRLSPCNRIRIAPASADTPGLLQPAAPGQTSDDGQAAIGGFGGCCDLDREIAAAAQGCGSGQTLCPVGAALKVYGRVKRLRIIARAGLRGVP